MKIENSLHSTAVRTPAGQSPKAGKSESSAVRSSASANVQLSTQLQMVETQAASEGVFDAKKVQDIKAAIAEGRFQVNSEAIADGLLATVKDLIQSHRRTA